MAIYESGLRFEQLQGIVNADAIDGLARTRGSVRNNRGFFQVVLSYQTPDASKPTGKRQVRLTRTTAYKYDKRASDKRKREIINEWRDLVLADANAVRGIDESPEQPVNELVERYIQRRESLPDTGTKKRGKGHITPATATHWRYSVKIFERFAFYGLPMANTTHRQIEDAIAELCESYAGGTIQGAFMVLRQTFSWVLGKNNESPCDDVDLPPQSYHPEDAPGRVSCKNILTVEQTKDLINECVGLISDDTRDSLAIGVLLMLTCGLRTEEVTALRWGDVDIQGEQVHVTGAINRWQDENGTWCFERGKTKTADSVRDVPLVPETLKALKQLRAKRLEQLMKLTPSEGQRIAIDACYVLGDLTGGFRRPSALGTCWKKYARRHEIYGAEGLAVSPHNLRDSYASRLAADGMAPSTLKALMGHSDYTTTAKYYVSSDEDTKRRAINEHMGALGLTGVAG